MATSGLSANRRRRWRLFSLDAGTGAPQLRQAKCLPHPDESWDDKLEAGALVAAAWLALAGWKLASTWTVSF